MSYFTMYKNNKINNYYKSTGLKYIPCTSVTASGVGILFWS